MQSIHLYLVTTSMWKFIKLPFLDFCGLLFYKYTILFQATLTLGYKIIHWNLSNVVIDIHVYHIWFCGDLFLDS